MTKEVSRDFARLLSALHKEVEGLKVQLKSQSEEILDLKRKLKSTQDDAVRTPSQKIRQAGTASPEELAALSAIASSHVDQELVRQAQTFEVPQPIAFAPSEQLLANLIQDSKQQPVEIALVVEEVPTAPTYKGMSPESEAIAAQHDLIRMNAARKALMPKPERGLGRLVNRSNLWAGPFDN